MKVKKDERRASLELFINKGTYAVSGLRGVFPIERGIERVFARIENDQA